MTPTPSSASGARAKERRDAMQRRLDMANVDRAHDYWADNYALDVFDLLRALDAARREGALETWEAAAKIAEEGRFLHDDAPDAQFDKACATAIRRAAALREERSDT